MRAGAARGWFAPPSAAERMAAMEFNAEDREMIAVLRNVVERRGGAALHNRRMLIGLLRDHLPDRARAIRLLMAAYEASDGASFTLEPEALESRARSLSDGKELREDSARWAVGIWAAALTPMTPERRGENGAAGKPSSEPFPAVAPAAQADPIAPASAHGPLPPPVKTALGVGLVRAAAPAAVAPSRARKSLTLLGAGVALAALAAVCLALRSASPGRSRPTVLTQGGDVATVVGATPDGAPVVLASDSPHRSDWPILPDAGHPQGNSRIWRFTTGIKFANGHVFYYRPTIEVGADFSAGAAELRAGDLSPGHNRNIVSVSSPSPAIRDPSVVDQLDLKFADWRDDAASAPPICLKLTLDPAAKTFEPRIFCATAISDGACGSKILGCGFFR